jgi:acyl-CoA hydrolase/GNAT superfamily N-acetyltransferase
MNHLSYSTAGEAFKNIRRGGRIFIGSGCAEPQVLSRALIEHAYLFADNPVVHILTRGEAAYTRPEYADNFRLNALFIGPNVREAVQSGRADYTPIFLSEIPALFRSGEMPIDAALIMVSPPDAQGYCSLGVSVDVVMAAVRSARVVIAQVNNRMPRTFGDSFIHVRDIHAFVEGHEELPELVGAPPTDIADRIGAHVATLVPDGATLQMGIGAIPDAVLRRLTDKNDLGVHTEMFSDGLLQLAQNGVVTGARKTLHQNVIVTSFCMGTRALYAWVHENPHVLFYPSDYVNDPGVIRQNARMVAINSALSVDLTGQVCADSIGSRFYSGIGGQVDFLRGAARSECGRPILALPATATLRDGRTISRITTALAEGAGVVTSRGDVHYVVTEFGIAALHGRSVTERARALIEIAHPDFRDELLHGAQERRYTCGDIGHMPPVPPPHLEHTHEFQGHDGRKVVLRFRPIRSSDERRLQDFFYSHSDETVRARYGYRPMAMPHSRALELVHLDYAKRLALVGVTGDPGYERIVAVGRYEPDLAAEATPEEIDRAIAGGDALAEVAFVVHEEYRGLGIASHLLGLLAREASCNGYGGLAARVSTSNAAMLRVFEKVLGAPASCTTGAGETMLQWNFENKKQTPQVSTLVGRGTGNSTVPLEVSQIRQNADVAA